MTSRTVMLAMVLTMAPGVLAAQSLGTFTWQLQPFCNVVTVKVTQQGELYTIDGYDDQCGAAQRAPLVGLATPNPDGTIGMGLNLVTVPGGRGLQVEARFSLPSANGSWSDSAGHAGTFAFGASTGGAARPLPSPPSGIPAVFQLQSDGGFLAGGALNTGVIPASGLGTRMMWHPRKAAFRAGHLTIPAWDDVNVGLYSAAFGLNTVASGASGAAFGEETQALGVRSAAFGFNTAARGRDSIALGSGTSTDAQATSALATGSATQAIGAYTATFGVSTSATGTASAAFGNQSVAAGTGSVAAGFQGFANGAYSVAMGTRVAAGGNGSVVLGSDATARAAASGSFIFGDQSTTTDIEAFVPNQFLVRASGGVGIYTNAALTAGVELDPNDSTWNVLSDVNMKEHFRDLAGEDVLAKLARMPVQEWSYKAQGPTVRHVGPTAQDFHAAFGLGTNPLRISTVDADGIALAGVRALEARTRELMRENDDLRARLARLEALLDKR
ncbi:MAG: tail fiber domain-containing protein [Acidobacteriota bacterium]|nr:tail fiber domain-containing protein [Acidobacteriota bacterium]